MIGPMHKTGEEIFNTLQLVKEGLGVGARSSLTSLKPGEIYRHKIYAFYWFMNKKGEFMYAIKDLKYDKKEEDNVSNPLTAINVMIMISSLKDKFGDKIHETTRKGYLTTQDMIPYKYYKLYLWYWCDECTYGIRECTAKDFNIKEEEKIDVSKMTKEQALKAIDDLKKYVEKREEKEKEIPRMHRGLLPKAQPVIVCPWMKGEDMPLWWKDITECMTFNEDGTFLTWGILAYELAQLMYAREYLKADVKELLEACKYGYAIFKLVYDITECKYVIVKVSRYQALNERDYVWCFTDKDDSEKVRDYMNKYVAHVKKNVF